MKYHQFTPEPDALAARILAQQASSEPTSAPPETSGAAPPPMVTPPQKVAATVDALTALRDRAFVEAAYRVLLGREVDPSGLAGFVHQLRSGALDKVDILGDLRHSPEGEQRAVDIAGLKWRYALRRLGRRPGIGWLFRWALAVLRLPTAVRVAQRHQAEIEQASMVAEEHAAAIQQVGSDLRDIRAHARTLATRTQTAE